MKLSDIHTTNWQLGLTTTAPALDVEDINQSISIILLTRKGADPFRPHFGCGLLDYIDKPAQTALPRMKKEILEAIRAYEPRIKVKKIIAEVDNG